MSTAIRLWASAGNTSRNPISAISGAATTAAVMARESANRPVKGYAGWSGRRRIRQ